MRSKITPKGRALPVNKPADTRCKRPIHTAQGTALLVVDVQNDYFPNGRNQMSGAEAASKKAQEIIRQFRAASLTVAHVQHINLSPEGTFFLPGTLGAAIHDLAKPLSGEPVITKHKVSSFDGTGLLATLQDRSINTLVIVGMQTNVCVQAIALEALQYALQTTVVTDACAAKTPAIHADQLEKLKPSVRLIESSEVPSLLASIKIGCDTLKG